MMEIDWIPAFFSAAWVPPVETISTPNLASALAKSIKLVLSETLISARLIFTAPVALLPIINLLCHETISSDPPLRFMERGKEGVR